MAGAPPRDDTAAEAATALRRGKAEEGRNGAAAAPPPPERQPPADRAGDTAVASLAAAPVGSRLGAVAATATDPPLAAPTAAYPPPMLPCWHHLCAPKN